MVENLPIIALAKYERVEDTCDSGAAIIGLEFDIFGEPHWRCAQAGETGRYSSNGTDAFYKTGTGGTEATWQRGKVCSLLQRLLGVLQLPGSPVGPRGLSYETRSAGNAGKPRQSGIAILSRCSKKSSRQQLRKL